jgi:F-type H+-transporting ATPase subunit a
MSLPPLSSSPAIGFVRRATLCAGLAAILASAALGTAAEPSAPVAEQNTTAPAQSEAPAKKEEHRLPAAAVPLYYGIGGHPAVTGEDGQVIESAKFGPFAVTNSILFTWIVTIFILAFAQYATRQIKQVPDGAQNVWEWLVESLRDFLESIIGRPLTAKTFWFFATVFIFILFSNWFGLLPGVGTIGWGVKDATGQMTHITHPLLRGVNADLNMTFGMAAIFFLCWIVWAIQANGFGGALMHVFGPKGQVDAWWAKIAMACIFFVVGLLEVVSILFRPISLSFRLYGNIFAGENMLEAMANLIPSLAGIIPIPFYFMELLVGTVQALVFMLLTAVFTLLICSHEDEPHAAHH